MSLIKKAFVIGWPIEHSKSPILHGHWLSELGIDGTYEKVAVEPEKLDSFIRNIEENGFVGGNVTVPHKERAFSLVDEADEIASALGAVNTIWIEHGKRMGTNTDGYGFAANLDDHSPGWRSGKTAIVLGAGGAARAVLWSIGQAGYDTVHIINRTVSKAEELADKFGSKFTARGWDDLPELLDQCDLLVNTTTLGMSGTSFPLDILCLPKSAIVTDIVYTPLETPLLKMANDRGLQTVDGLGMLLHQALPGFEKWFGVRPKVTKALREKVLAN